MRAFFRYGQCACGAAFILSMWTLSARAQTAPPAAPPAAPPKIDTGDTAWMLTSTALVLMMTIPGLALFYGGMVRKMNVLATVMQSFAVTCLVTVLWAVAGYSLAFTEGTPFIGGPRRLLLARPGGGAITHIAPTRPESGSITFHLTF